MIFRNMIFDCGFYQHFLMRCLIFISLGSTIITERNKIFFSESYIGFLKRTQRILFFRITNMNPLSSFNSLNTKKKFVQVRSSADCCLNEGVIKTSENLCRIFSWRSRASMKAKQTLLERHFRTVDFENQFLCYEENFTALA